MTRRWTNKRRRRWNERKIGRDGDIENMYRHSFGCRRWA